MQRAAGGPVLALVALSALVALFYPGCSLLIGDLALPQPADAGHQDQGAPRDLSGADAADDQALRD